MAEVSEVLRKRRNLPLAVPIISPFLKLREVLYDFSMKKDQLKNRNPMKMVVLYKY